MTESLNALTEAIIGAALEVHRELGPGLLENAYESCLAVELLSRGFSLERQHALPVVYKNQRVDCGYRLDLVVEGAGSSRSRPSSALSECIRSSCCHLRFAKCHVGLLFNFHAGFLTQDGLKRVINSFPE